jgi:(p)ppGpp synthase/HD superfamily hydrolase
VIERLRTIGQVEDYEVLTAAALHDVVEDCEVSIEYIASTFGSRIGLLVGELSRAPEQTDDEYVKQLRNATRDSKAIKLSDRWDNIVDLLTFRKERFGTSTSEEYIKKSRIILAACKDANTPLAISLEAELEEAARVYHLG